MRPVVGDAEPRRRGVLAVPEEDVNLLVGVGRDEIAGDRFEDDVAPVAADPGGGAGGVGLGAVGRHADADGAASRAIVHEDVGARIGVVSDQRRGRDERHVAAVRRDVGRDAVPDGFRTIGPHADPSNGAGLPVLHEDVGRSVRVACDERRVGGRERYETSVGAGARLAAGAGELGVPRGGADARGQALRAADAECGAPRHRDCHDRTKLSRECTHLHAPGRI